MYNKFYFLILISIGFIFTRCANQTSPTGGPKDTIPPSLVNSIPTDQTINFSGSDVSLTFNEYIKLNNARQQIIITPRLDQEITYTSRRNKAFIEFSEPLEPNTTYSINFREGIQDITENNPARLKLAFSTGSFIDSLQISGTVFEVLKGVPAENILVCLQEPVDTTHYFLQPPKYFTRSAKDGSFLFTNLKVSDYHLYAFNDINNDQKLQPSREKHGFIPDLLVLRSDTFGIDIPLVNNNTDTLKLISARQAGKHFEVNFNKYVTNYKVEFIGESLPYMLTEDHKTIRFFNISSLNNSSLPAIVTAYDSVEFQVLSEIDISYTESARSSYDFAMSPADLKIVKSNPQIKTKVEFNKPVQSLLHDSIFVFVDSLNILPLTGENYSFDSSRTVMNLFYPLNTSLYKEPESTDEPAPGRQPKGATYIYFGRGAFMSVENDSSKQNKITAKMFNDDQLGVVRLNVDVPFENFTVELLDNKNNVIERRYNEQQLRFTNLIPATYYVRILEDFDNDHFWDPGNIFKNSPPEEVIHYVNPDNKKDVIIRANWDVGPFDIIW